MKQELKLGDLEALGNSSFDPSLPTKLFAHGWNADASSGYSTRTGMCVYLLRVHL